MLQLQHLQKHYDGRPILDIAGFQFNHSIHWISGVNGSGKTTLLKIISGMIPFRGEVKIDGTSLKKNPVGYRKLISFAEAEPLYPSFITGHELLIYFASIRKASTEETKELINVSGLGQALDKPVGTYSSGMVKRLSLLLAFIGHLPLILLDEPFATLDGEAVEALPQLIHSYRKRYGTSFIFSSHQALPESLHIDFMFLIRDHTIHSFS